MKIAFRADASVQIGTGHVMRCLTLAEELRRQGHQCLFVCRDHKGNLADLIGQKGFELYMLPTPHLSEDFAEEGSGLPHADWLGVSLQLDADQTKGALLGHNPDWLVVDHYSLDARWEGQFTDIVSRIMVIDDLADRDHECDVLLDQNLGRQSEDYNERVPLGCQTLIGPQYALLRPEFSELRSASLERRRPPELKRILISLGGIDQRNVTGQVLEALSQSILPQDTLLDIVMGRAALHLESIKKLATNIPFDTKVNVGVSDMAMRMYRADLAIGAAGGTAWERCSLGLPSILLILAENQVSGAKALVDAGAAMTPGKGSALTAALSSMLDSLNKDSGLLTKMAEAGAKLTDGKGAEKVCDSFVISKECGCE